MALLWTWPSEAASARATLALKRLGIERAFPLEAWLAAGYSVLAALGGRDHREKSSNSGSPAV